MREVVAPELAEVYPQFAEKVFGIVKAGLAGRHVPGLTRQSISQSMHRNNNGCRCEPGMTDGRRNAGRAN